MQGEAGSAGEQRVGMLVSGVVAIASGGGGASPVAATVGAGSGGASVVGVSRPVWARWRETALIVASSGTRRRAPWRNDCPRKPINCY